ncbi:MAG: glycine zipper 2TM domain-containing protein [Colwellia sp.]
MKLLAFTLLLTFMSFASYATTYDRNKAVPVEQVIFGHVASVRNITKEEIIQDRNRGWKTFGGALIGGLIGNQFGSGSGRDAMTILGAFAGGAIARNNSTQQQVKTWQLVEMMITAEDGKQYMVIQDYDPSMVFQPQNAIRLVYLADGTVRVDKQY